MIFEILLLSIVTLMGIVASYTDLKYGIIKNSLIGIGFIIGSFINFFEILFHFQNFSIVILNLFLSFLICFFLWLLGILPGGDAKLIIAFSFLIPPSFYKYVYLSLFPSLSLLVNIFVIPALIFLVLAFYYGDKGKVKKVFKEEVYPERILNFFILAISVYGFVRFLINMLGLPSNFFTSSVFVFLFFLILRSLNLSRVKIYMIYLLLILLNFYFIPSQFFSINYLISSVFVAFYGIILTFLFFFSDLVYSEEVKIKDLKPGMRLAEIIVKRGKYYVKENFRLRAFIDILYLSEKRVKENILYIDEYNLRKLKTLSEKRLLKFDKIRVTKTIPFAPFITIGTAITIFLKGQFILSFFFQFL